jgi:hypothetical protein
MTGFLVSTAPGSALQPLGVQQQTPGSSVQQPLGVQCNPCNNMPQGVQSSCVTAAEN